MAVVKADGYGHGAVELAARAVESGADWLGVARLEEAVELRRSGVAAPTLVFGETPAASIDELLEHDLAQTVFTTDSAASLAAAAARRGQCLRVHLKIDTGMGRLGWPWVAATEPAPVLDAIEAIARVDGLELQGIFTHFANADRADKTDAGRQLERFLDLLARLERRGIRFPIRHAANSAALIDLPEAHLDMVRTGIATYGLYPEAAVQGPRIALEPVLTWKTRILQLKRVPAGFGVSYGTTYRTRQPTILATVAVGYADGLDRRLSSRGQMLVGGRPAPIAGRVSMDLTVLDLGPDADAAVGDEVVVLGSQGARQITADEMAAMLDTIHYEIVTSIAARVPRVYLE